MTKEDITKFDFKIRSINYNINNSIPTKYYSNRVKEEILSKPLKPLIILNVNELLKVIEELDIP